MEAPATGRPVAPPKPAYRPEIQGLRALAVLMVVTYHIWFGRVSGGVDIFLLISAFLLSLSFIRKVEQGRALELGKYWLHAFKRLLPAVVVVLLGTLAATYLFVPRSRWDEILSQTWSSLLYFQNWVLAANSVDYYAADQGVASPLQHFWSLSIQGQVFVLWPLLFALAAFISRRTRLKFRAVVLLVFGAVFLASFVFSIMETYGNQAHAYFDTRTRLWEFAVGTLLALALPYLKWFRFVRVCAGWLGLALMLSVGFVLDVQGQFPGYVALVPLAAAGLVIVAGQTGSPFGADRFLSLKPLARLGEMSYALYLWHWPVLVIYLAWRGRQEVGVVGGTAIIALSLVLAYLTTRFVEKPLRRSAWLDARWSRSLLVIAVSLAMVALPVAGAQYAIQVQNQKLKAEAETNYPGARVLMPDYVAPSTEQAPIMSVSGTEPEHWGRLELRCADVPDGPEYPALQGRCSSTTNYEDPEKTILVIGSSHAQQWLEAAEPMAEAHNYRIVSLLLGMCPYGESTESRPPECNEFNEAATRYALDLKPDAVLAMGTVSVVEGKEDPVVEGFPEAARQLTEAGISVAAIRDNPRFADNMQWCAEQHGADSPQCTSELSERLSPVSPYPDAFTDLPELAWLDFSDLICPEGTCRPVIGNMHVYVDNNHLTTSYTASMSQEFDRRFHTALGW